MQKLRALPNGRLTNHLLNHVGPLDLCVRKSGSWRFRLSLSDISDITSLKIFGRESIKLLRHHFLNFKFYDSHFVLLYFCYFTFSNHHGLSGYL